MKNLPFLLVMVAFSAYFLAACLNSTQSVETVAGEPAPMNSWTALLEVTPVPYTSPLPPPDVSPLDGTYAGINPGPPQWWSCLRCADYRPVGGAWRLAFERGVMRIYYEVTGWQSLASYTVSGDRLYLYNDPYCKGATGEYRWELENDALMLQVVEDPCSFELRGRNLSGQPWLACPAEGSAGIQSPRGCTDVDVESLPVPVFPGVPKVTVYQADMRLSPEKPDLLIDAFGGGLSNSNEVRLTYSEDSLPYGINRVLWKDTDWMAVRTQAPFTAIGVQFRGDYVIGWARVLFDGREVWRGDTSQIWSELRNHGGYIEVSDFEPGEHTLRVERLDLDTRPVVVAFFGFRR